MFPSQLDRCLGHIKATLSKLGEEILVLWSTEVLSFLHVSFSFLTLLWWQPVPDSICILPKCVTCIAHIVLSWNRCRFSGSLTKWLFTDHVKRHLFDYDAFPNSGPIFPGTTVFYPAAPNNILSLITLFEVTHKREQKTRALCVSVAQTPDARFHESPRARSNELVQTGSDQM